MIWNKFCKQVLTATIIGQLIFGASISIARDEAQLEQLILYECDSSSRLEVLYALLDNGTNTARLSSGDKVYLMTQARAASGARYEQQNAVWWIKGNSGFLQIENRVVLRDCFRQPPLQ